MLQLRCTQKVIKQLGLTAKDLDECRLGDTPLGNWYMNLFMLDRRKTFIFMNERTLYSFIVPGITKASSQTFPDIFYTGLAQSLLDEGFEINIIDRIFEAYREYGYTKINSKKLLGNMNELVQLFTYCVMQVGGLKHCKLSQIIMDLNHMPQRNIGWGYSIDMVKEILAGQTV